MQLSELIKQATDSLAIHGDIVADIEVNFNRYNVSGIEVQTRRSTSKDLVAVIYASGKDEDNYK